MLVNTNVTAIYVFACVCVCVCVCMCVCVSGYVCVIRTHVHTYICEYKEFGNNAVFSYKRVSKHRCRPLSLAPHTHTRTNTHTHTHRRLVNTM